MYPSKPADPVETAAGIMAQLTKYTSQLAASENNPEVDVAALTEACGQRLEDLKSVLPLALKDPDHRQGLVDAARKLQTGIECCSEALQNARNKAAREIDTLSRSRRAMQAYGT